MRPIVLASACCAAVLGATAPRLSRATSPAPVHAASPPGDASLTAPEYVAAGFPATDRAWTPQDYGPAYETLAKLVSGRDGTVLPRAGSARSGAVFARMVDRRNFDVAADRSLPIGSRAPALLGAMQPLVGTLKLYLAAYIASKGKMDAEILDLQCLMLHATRRVADAMDEVPAPEPGSDGRASYDAGLAQMRRGEGEVVIGALQSFEGAAATVHRTRFAACLADEVPGTYRHLTAEARLEVRNRVRRAAEREPAASEAKPYLARLSAAVSAAR